MKILLIIAIVSATHIKAQETVNINWNKFPLESSIWKIGEFTPKLIPNLLTISYGFFIIGCDPVSEKWLIKNKRSFVLNKSVGFVIKCKTLKHFEKIQSLALPIHIAGANLDILSKEFNHNLYPVYVHGKGMEQ